MASSRLLLLKSTSQNNLALSLRRCLSCSNVAKKAAEEDKVTHTGQKWSSDDYRLVRFTNHPKHVNPNVAIDLIAKVCPKPKKERVVFCDGDVEGSLGHPRVYINLDKPGNHSCLYCGLRFYKEDHH